MKLCKKVFLLVVGVTTIAFDEFSKSIDEATQSIDKGRKKIKKRGPRSQKQNNLQRS